MNTIDLIRAIVSRVLGDRLDYLALYPARVVVQNDDGTLDLQPDDARLPAMQRVPIRYGVPGVTATAAPGSNVLVGFEAGDPARPVAMLWEVSSTPKRSLARVGDTATTGFLSGFVGSTPVTFLLTPQAPTEPPTLDGNGQVVGGAAALQLTATINENDFHLKA